MDSDSDFSDGEQDEALEYLHNPTARLPKVKPGQRFPLPILNADDGQDTEAGNGRPSSRGGRRGRSNRGRGHRSRVKGGSNDDRTISNDRNGENQRPPHRGQHRGNRGGRGRSDRGSHSNNTFDEVANMGHSSYNRNHSVSRKYPPEKQRSVEERHESSKNVREPRRERIFGYKKLKELSESTDPDTVAMEIITGKSGFQTLLQKSELERDWIILLIDVLTVAFKSNMRSCLLNLAHLLSKENVLGCHIVPFLNKLSISAVIVDNKESFFVKICALMKDLMQRIPEKAIDCNMVIMCLNMNCQTDGSLSNKDALLQEISTVSDMKDFILKDLETQKQEQLKDVKSRRHKDTENMPPPDDFRELSVLPELKDLHFYEKPFLRANKVQGRYNDLQHYLDVQFRLLREDYMQPLRNGILEYRKEREHGNVKKKFQDIRLYHKVQIIRPLCTNRGILHVLQFDVSKMRNIRWDSSRRLLHGSLLCLSQDDFETVFFATVSNRDAKELGNGYIQVQFQGCISEVLEVKANAEFVMAETTAYFEAYRHILQGLQETKENMPLQRYIVNCEKTVKPPDYVLRSIGIVYDFAPLLKRIIYHDQDYSNVPVINTRHWPTAAELELDDSQYKALQMAVTKEFALIQGPPGTGKTFVGLKIAELLLHNKTQWQRNTGTSPILVVCYTNHALDQFVEGIAEFCSSIVRIGGRCSNPAIEPFMMKNLRKTSHEHKSLSRTVHERKIDCKKQMYQLRTAIENVGVRLQVSRMGIVNEIILENFMDDLHFKSLKRKECENVMESWLQITASSKCDTNDTEMSDNYEAIFSRWEEEIVKGVTCGLESIQEIDDIPDLWQTDLLDRAGIYHLWIESYQKELMNNLEKIEENLALLQRNGMSQNFDEQRQEQIDLQQKIQNSYSTVVTEQALIQHVSKVARSQIMRLKSKAPYKNTIVLEWLCLQRDSNSAEAAMKALNAIQENDTIDVMGEAEEENQARNLDDDYDEDDLLTSKVSSLSNLLDHNLIEKQLAMSFDDVQSAMTGESEWVSATTKKATKNAMKRMLSLTEPFTVKKEQAIEDVWKLPIDGRFSLYKLWLIRYQNHLRESIKETERQYSEMCLSYQEVLDAEDAEIIMGTDVIAMTTTGAAKYRNILLAVKPQIIIVEEAAEVLESHIVTSINENCQHLILIGDHKQLRPTPTVYNLAVKYNLEISLFERMIKNEMNFVTLGLQHRMRPEISTIIRHIYPDLKDDESVLKHPKVLGVDPNMFYINHSYPEVSHEETHSKSNVHEAEYMTSLCHYFLNQGYKPSQITVLTTYTGQMLLLKRNMPRKDFEGIRITVVDNFQGEENDIILLSLVRSNKNDSVGFLKIDNRICVALSRARVGFFVIGNFSLLSSQSTLWAQITETLRQRNSIGSALILRCQNHEDSIIHASTKSDFELTPNGGCRKTCDARLSCGHVCEQFCHIKDKEHRFFRCFKKCEKILCQQGHKCSKPCYQQCGECKEKVMKIIPICKHTQECPCSKDPHLIKCKANCEKILDCGHLCRSLCGTCKERGRHEIKCQEIKVCMLKCGHEVQCKCHETLESLRCTQPCDVELDCGHKCIGTCSDCFQGRLHVQCMRKCNKHLICGHRCRQKCGVPCRPCDQPCRNKCFHSKCSEKCGSACVACTMPCQSKCEHDECKKLCGEMCDKLPCDHRCPKKLDKCKHQCIGLCGEICPTICYFCNKDKLDIICPKATEDTTFIKLENCNHIVDTETMDRWMRNEDVSPTVQIRLKTCPVPNCNQTILNSHRYSNILKAIRNDIEKVKKIITGSPAIIRRRLVFLKRKLEALKSEDANNSNTLMALIEESSLGQDDLAVVENQCTLLQGVHSLLAVLDQDATLRMEVCLDTREELKQLITWIMKLKHRPHKSAEFKFIDRKSFTSQELRDIKNELKRYGYIAKLMIIADKTEMAGKHTDFVQKMDKYIRTFRVKTDINQDWEKKAELYIRTFGNGISRLGVIQSSYNLMQAESAESNCWLKCQEEGHVFSTRTSSKTCPVCKRDSKNTTTVCKPVEKTTSTDREDDEKRTSKNGNPTIEGTGLTNFEVRNRDLKTDKKLQCENENQSDSNAFSERNTGDPTFVSRASRRNRFTEYEPYETSVRATTFGETEQNVQTTMSDVKAKKGLEYEENFSVDRNITLPNTEKASSSLKRAQVIVGQDRLTRQQPETACEIRDLSREANSAGEGAGAEPTCIHSGCLNPQSKGMSQLCMDHFLIQQHAIMEKIKQSMRKNGTDV